MDDKVDEKIDLEQENLKFDPQIIRSLIKSKIRVSILLYLNNIYPHASYPAEISRKIDAHPMNVIGALKGAGNRYNSTKSLVVLGLVYTIDLDGAIFYKLSNKGQKVVTILEIIDKK